MISCPSLPVGSRAVKKCCCRTLRRKECPKLPPSYPGGSFGNAFRANVWQQSLRARRVFFTSRDHEGADGGDNRTSAPSKIRPREPLWSRVLNSRACEEL